jgi:hypothetical protein
MLVLARFRKDAGLLGGLFETAKRALNRLAWSNANFHSIQHPPYGAALAGAQKIRPTGPCVAYGTIRPSEGQMRAASSGFGN